VTRLGVSVVLSATAAATSGDIKARARHAEQAGLDGIFTGDHLAAATPRLDAAIVLGIAAAATSQVKHVPITGNVNQAAERLAEYATAGVSHLVVGLIGEDRPGQCDLLAQARAALPA
jgi:alkanesulfonate monooxygenase SsuD/methylene tetrahydromethanopterin reductase-like flavin-dependent oxidoreductase (luciferase family)